MLLFAAAFCSRCTDHVDPLRSSLAKMVRLAYAADPCTVCIGKLFASFCTPAAHDQFFAGSRVTNYT
jgi:hypothetical protein